MMILVDGNAVYDATSKLEISIKYDVLKEMFVGTKENYYFVGSDFSEGPMRFIRQLKEKGFTTYCTHFKEVPVRFDGLIGYTIGRAIKEKHFVIVSDSIGLVEPVKQLCVKGIKVDICFFGDQINPFWYKVFRNSLTNLSFVDLNDNFEEITGTKKPIKGVDREIVILP